MKKTIAFGLSLLLALSLAACGGSGKDAKGKETEKPEDTAPVEETQPTGQEKEPEPASEPAEEPAADLTWGTVLSDPSHFNKNNLTPEQIAMLEKDAKENDYTISWDKDGYLTVTEANGNVFDFTGSWPKNELTEKVPVPNTDWVISSAMDGASFVAALHWTMDDAKAYAASLKEKGYDRDVSEMSGLIYLFMANNGEYTVTVSVSADYDAVQNNGAVIITPKD